MIPVLTSEQMKEADRTTIEDLGVDSLVLMEMAAAAVTDAVVEHFSAAHRVVVVCGPGNNGGDGLAVARQLRCRTFDAEVVLAVDEGTLGGDARRQLELARSFGVPVRSGTDAVAERVAAADVVVDAVFGTGLDRPPEGDLAEVVRVVNRAVVPVVAVDMPSGLAGSRSEVPGEAVKADVTVTFAAPKVAHLLPPACWQCGEVVVGDIGIPPWVLDAVADLRLAEAADVARWLPDRAPDAHKGVFGHLAVLAGRLGRVGAAALSARAGVTCGAGLVTVGTAANAVSAVHPLVPEAMVDGLPYGPDGQLTGEGIEAVLERATAVAVGPGLGTGDGPRRLVERLLELWDGPLLIDADGLNVLAGRLGVLAGRGGPTVLTPHPGELGRLLGRSTDDVVAHRLEAAREAARTADAVVLAKGARTLIARPDGDTVISSTGTPGLASGGAGDVLTGVIGAFLAQGVGARAAAVTGAYLHGLAAELAAAEFPGALPAADLVNHLPAAEAQLRSRREP